MTRLGKKKERKRKPNGYWRDLGNQKKFLDGLLKKYRLQPAELTYSLIVKNGGARSLDYSKNTIDLLETHYGPISLLDVQRVPPGTWRVKQNRVRAVREAVKRLGKKPARISSRDFVRMNLDGLMTSIGKTHIPLLQEAGFKVPDPVSWKSKKNRVAKIKELVEKGGGPSRVTHRYIFGHAPGLNEYYKNNPKELPGSVYVPILYWMLKDAGYDVEPEDCIRGLRKGGVTLSRHGDWNHSPIEALTDDWVNDIVGKAHLHDIIYPGQDGVIETDRKDCDYVLLPEAGLAPGKGLWVEYAGLAKTRRVTDLEKRYHRKLQTKKKLAKRAGLQLVIITTARMQKNPAKIWEEMVSKAPWLKKKKKQALESRYFKDFPLVPDLTRIRYRRYDSKYTRDYLIQQIQTRIWHEKPLSIDQCIKDRSFNKYYQVMRRLSRAKYGTPIPKTWWGEWLMEAGLPEKEAMAKSRKRW